MLRVFLQNCLNRNSPGVVPDVGQREGTGSIRTAQRLPSEQISAGAMGEKVSGDFTKPGEPFVFRIHQDAGYITLPHTDPIDE